MSRLEDAITLNGANLNIVKIKGTRTELQICGDWFLTHPAFQSYVRHVEVWVPLFEVTTEPRPRAPLRVPSNAAIGDVPGSPASYGPYAPSAELIPVRRMFQTQDKATLEEIFSCTQVLFTEACALTIEGGHCKKSRKIQHFRTLDRDKCLPLSTTQSVDKSHVLVAHKPRQFAEHRKIRTLILKGSWNILRQTSDFQNLAAALPNLREWHCVYAKPKTDGYKSMCGILRHFPPTISKLNICLEGLNGKQPSSLAKWRKLYPDFHICKDLGRLLPRLESLTFTGHVCSSLFRSAIAAISTLRDVPKLKSIDLFVRNCCRDSTDLDDGPGIHNWPFIQSFEQLVVEAVTALGVYPQLKYMRIRFLDLDSPRPLLNPYFHVDNNICSGMWSKNILAALSEARASAQFETIVDANILDWFDGTMFSRPKSMKASSYAALAQGSSVI